VGVNRDLEGFVLPNTTRHIQAETPPLAIPTGQIIINAGRTQSGQWWAVEGPASYLLGNGKPQAITITTQTWAPGETHWQTLPALTLGSKTVAADPLVDIGVQGNAWLFNPNDGTTTTPTSSPGAQLYRLTGTGWQQIATTAPASAAGNTIVGTPGPYPGQFLLADGQNAKTAQIVNAQGQTAGQWTIPAAMKGRTWDNSIVHSPNNQIYTNGQGVEGVFWSQAATAKTVRNQLGLWSATGYQSALNRTQPTAIYGFEGFYHESHPVLEAIKPGSTPRVTAVWMEQQNHWVPEPTWIYTGKNQGQPVSAPPFVGPNPRIWTTNQSLNGQGNPITIFLQTPISR